MEISDLPWYGHILFGGLVFGLFGLLCMTGASPGWQNVQGWLIVSYAFIPLGLVVIAILVAYPPLLFGALFLLGAAAMKR